LEFKIESISNIILSLLKEGKLEFTDEPPIDITYHDPCHSYRMAKKPDQAPRNLIKAIPWMNLLEMKSIEKGSMCCGAGGGLKAGNPDLALKIASARIRQAMPLNVQFLVSTCPFCKRNLADAQQTLDLPIQVVDLVELIAERLK
jgi:heterodisulfide reductase subunit D